MHGRIGRQKMLAEIYKECGSIFGKGNTPMTDKQIIIYKKECYNEPYCSLNQVLEQLKAKEQECEELKKQHQGDKGLITSTGKINYQLIQEYDKLKAENEELKRKVESYNCSTNCYKYEQAEKLKQTLAEIKQIASREAETSRYNGSSTWKQILQKISECEVENVASD